MRDREFSAFPADSMSSANLANNPLSSPKTGKLFDLLKTVTTGDREDPNQPYTTENIATRLRLPAKTATGTNTSLLYAPQLKRSGMQTNLDTRFKPDGTISLPQERIYTGPIYLQGNSVTCHPWAVIHAMHAVNITPDNTFATKLINSALPPESYAGGIDSADLNTLINDSPESKISHTHAHDLTTAKFGCNSLASFIKTTLDDTAAVLAIIQPTRQTAHAICIPGYRITHDTMNLQIIDSGSGEYFMPIEKLTEWVAGSARFPWQEFSVITPKTNAV